MKILKRIIFISVVMLVSTLVPLASHAQVDPCTDPADPCPIDSGVVFLIGAVILIAAKKAYDYKTIAK
jgi:hypothetical protein